MNQENSKIFDVKFTLFWVIILMIGVAIYFTIGAGEGFIFLGIVITYRSFLFWNED